MDNKALMRRRSTDFPRTSFFDDVFSPSDDWMTELFPETFRENAWHPVTDIYDRDEDVVVELEVPGMSEDDLTVRMEKDHLIIEGCRERSEKMKEEDCTSEERFFGEFHRVLHINVSVDADNACADYKNGILTITLPKSKESKSREIPLKS